MAGYPIRIFVPNKKRHTKLAFCSPLVATPCSSLSRKWPVIFCSSHSPGWNFRGCNKSRRESWVVHFFERKWPQKLPGLIKIYGFFLLLASYFCYPFCWGGNVLSQLVFSQATNPRCHIPTKNRGTLDWLRFGCSLYCWESYDRMNGLLNLSLFFLYLLDLHPPPTHI